MATIRSYIALPFMLVTAGLFISGLWLLKVSEKIAGPEEVDQQD